MSIWRQENEVPAGFDMPITVFVLPSWLKWVPTSLVKSQYFLNLLSNQAKPACFSLTKDSRTTDSRLDLAELSNEGLNCNLELDLTNNPQTSSFILMHFPYKLDLLFNCVTHNPFLGSLLTLCYIHFDMFETNLYLSTCMIPSGKLNSIFFAAYFSQVSLPWVHQWCSHHTVWAHTSNHLDKIDHWHSENTIFYKAVSYEPWEGMVNGLNGTHLYQPDWFPCCEHLIRLFSTINFLNLWLKAY